MTLSAATTA